MATREHTSYCLPCDRVIRWKSWRTWQAHLGSAEHRECVIAPRPLPADRLRPADLDDQLYGLEEGESVVFRRPDGRWIGLASLGDGASLRIEDKLRSLLVERLIRRLGPDAREPRQLRLHCLLILDPVIVGHHNTSRGHRERKEPDLEAEAVVPAVRQTAALGHYATSPCSGNPPFEWWNETLPGALAAAIEAEGFEPFHAVVVDEGQDFELGWVQTLERLLSSPAQDVLWVFHDPGQAVIRNDVVGELGLDRVELYENLRNPTSIADLSGRFYVGGTSVSAYRPGDGGSRHRVETAEPGPATLDALRRELHRLVVDEKVPPFGIAVLSGVTANESLVWRQRTFGNEVLVNEAIDNAGRSKGLAPEDLPEDPDDVLFETIRRFKGLERDVVVLVELPPDLRRLDQVLYTGLTRATTHLTVIAPPELIGRLRGDA